VPSTAATSGVADLSTSISHSKTSSFTTDSQLHIWLSCQLNSVWLEDINAAEVTKKVTIKSRQVAKAAERRAMQQFILIFWNDVHHICYIFLNPCLMAGTKNTSPPSLCFVESKDIPNWPVWSLNNSLDLLPSLGDGIKNVDFYHHDEHS